MRTTILRNFSLVIAASFAFSGFGALGASTASAETSTWLGQAGGGQTHECMVRSDGRVKCWGYNNPGGYLGGLNYTAATYPFTMTLVNGITTAKRVSVGYFNTCILLADTTVKCMGDNANGQIGDGTNTSRNDTPTTVSGLTGVKDVVLGGQTSGSNAHACALMLDGTVKCWGANNYGQLGDGTRTDRWVPVSVSGITNAVSIVSNFSTVCAVLSTGSVKCWGYGGIGVLGNGNSAYTTTNFSTTPVNVIGVTNAVDLSTESVGYGMCARTTIGEVYCWGSPRVPGYNYPGPAKIAGISGAKQFIPGGCWITASDTVKCFAPGVPSGAPDQANVFGELGNGTSCALAPGVTCPGTNTPGVDVTGLTGVAQLSLMDRLFCARLTAGSIHCWGDNIYGIAANKLTNAGLTPGYWGFISSRLTPTPFRVMELSVGPEITSAPAALSNSQSGTVAFSSDSSATTECKIDTGAWAICTSPFSYSGLAGGAHKIYVRSTDPGGLTSPEVSASFSIDVTPPAAPSITAGPVNASTVSTTSGSFTFTGEAGARFECQLDGGTWTTCTSPNAFTGLADGSHTFSTRAIDAVGNVGTATSRTWTVDTTVAPPVLTYKPDALTTRTSNSFIYTGETGATFQCSINGGTTWAACTGLSTYYQSDGTYTFAVKQTDKAGNVSSPLTWTYTVDSTPPAAPTITSSPSSPTTSTSATFTFTGAEPGGTFECVVDGGRYPVYVPCESPVTYSNVTTGWHTFSVRQKDAAGNVAMWGGNATSNWTVSQPTPPPTLTSAPSGTVNTGSGSVVFSIPTGLTAVCSVDGAAYAPCTSPLDLTGLADGPHNVQIKTFSSMGGLSTPITASWTVDSTAPAVPTITKEPADLSNSSAPNFGFTLEANATAECQLDGGAWTACDLGIDYTGLTDGEHTISVRQKDEAGNVSPQTDFTWTIDTSAPATPSITSPTNGASTATDSVTFDQVDGVTYKCQIDGGDIVDCTSPFDVSSLKDGEHTVKIWSVDPAGNESDPATLDFTRDTTAPAAPTIGGVPGNGTTDYTATLTLDGAGAGESYECQVNGGAWAVCTSPFEVSGLADGPQSVKVRIVDDAGNVSSETEVKWSIGLYVTDPVVTSPASEAITADNSVEFTVQADTVTTCSLDGSPPFECSSPFDTSGLPEGVHTLDITSTDADGHYATKHFEWTIDRSAPATPDIGNIPASGTPVDSASLNLTGAEPGDTYECSINGADYAPCSSPLNLSGLPDGLVTVVARIKDAAGNIGEPSQALWVVGDAMPMPPSGQTGSITLSGPGSFKFGQNLLQTFNLPTFNVTTIWPAGARSVILSNSPSFTNSKRFPVASTAPWGNPVAKPGTFGSRTVYFKYRGAGIDQTQVYTSTFRWDRATPFINMAARKHLLGYKPDAWKVRLVGNDRGPAGLDKVQFWMRKDKMPKAAPIQGGWHSGYVTNWAPVVTVPGGYQPNWVRASDKAGNWSRWYLIK